MKWTSIAGFLVIAAVAGAIWYWQSIDTMLTKVTEITAVAQDVTVIGFIGSEKEGLLKDPEVIGILKRYGVTFPFEKAGSMEMVRSPAPGKDVLWPSNPVAVEMFDRNGGHPVAKESVFVSPLVFYAYADVADAFVTAGLASQEGGAYYVDVVKLAQALVDGRTWKDLGVPQYYGKVNVISTNPAVSSSGNMFAGLFASMANKGEVPTDATIDEILPIVGAYFQRLGMLDEGSATLFEKFLRDQGGHPIIVGYENQLVEFSLEHADKLPILRDRVRTLYPRPTVMSEHTVIALNENGKRLIEALKDPAIQRIAWERHGFRSGLMDVQMDPKVLQVTGIPERVTSVIPMPTASVMEKIDASLRQ